MGDEELAHRIGKAARELRRGATQDLRLRAYAGMVDLAQADALEVLVTDGPCKMSELAAALRVDASAATRTVHRLVEGGLVERSGAKTDGRAVVVSLTSEGRRVCSELSTRGVQAILDVLNDFDPSEHEQLAELLER